MAKFKLFVLVPVFIVFVAALSMAASKGNPNNGKYIFRLKCKTCHEVGSEGGEVTPMTYTMGQWKSFFARNKHKRYQDISDQFKSEELTDIERYVVDHAMDSEHPETCGG